jgi:hypothetical protein
LLNDDFIEGIFMGNDKKKSKVERGAELTGEVVGDIGKKGIGALKGFGKGLRKGFKKDK